MGLRIESLSAEEIVEISMMMGRYEQPSYADLSGLVLAKSKKTILITGDKSLQYAAIENGVICYGTCWLIDYLADQKLISYADAISAYNQMRKNRRYPPFDECKALLTRWKQRKKLLE